MKIAACVLTIFCLISLTCLQLEAQQYSEWSTPVNMGPSINTEFNDFQNAISADKKSIFFSSDRPDGFGDFDLWTAHRPNRNADWQPAQNVGPIINTDFGEFAPELSVDGHWLYFCNNNTGHIYTSFRKNISDNFGWESPVDLGSGVNKGTFNCDPTTFINPETGLTELYFARLVGQGQFNIFRSIQRPDGTFGNSQPVPELSTIYRDTHPTIRRDGLEMIFSSDRPGSVGQIDLWMSTRSNTHEKWSTPVNLGPQVNTVDQERAPYLTDDALTLILISDRPDGFGGSDLYVSTRKKLQ